MHILKESHEALKEAGDGSLLAKNLTLRAHLYMVYIYKKDGIGNTDFFWGGGQQNNEKVETAIEILEESLAMCKQAHDAFNYYRTTVELANGYLKLSNDTEKALYLIECSIPNVSRCLCKGYRRVVMAFVRFVLDSFVGLARIDPGNECCIHQSPQSP